MIFPCFLVSGNVGEDISCLEICLKNVSKFFSGGAVILDVLIVTVVGCNGGGTWSKELLLRLYQTKTSEILSSEV